MTLFGYIRTSRHLQDGVAGMDPFSQELRLREAGVQRGITSTETSASQEPPAPTSATAGTAWTGVFPEPIPWLSSASTESADGGWTHFSASSPCGPGG